MAYWLICWQECGVPGAEVASKDESGSRGKAANVKYTVGQL